MIMKLLLILYCTFYNPNHLRETYKNLIDKSFDTVFAAVKYGHPIERAFQLNKQNKVQFNNPEKEFIRTQDLNLITMMLANFIGLIQNL